ncbi:Protein CL16A, variant 2 [Homalodisca vitripennis]|nr:Protein CL16A, variant 2 [Homalodisca vitripennis]
MKARQKKMLQIAKLLDIPSNAHPSPSPPTYNLLALRHQTAHLYRNACARPLSNHRLPGGAVKTSSPKSVRSREGAERNRRGSGSTGVPAAGHNSPPHSPRLPRPRSEEIPMENMVQKV